MVKLNKNAKQEELTQKSIRNLNGRYTIDDVLGLFVAYGEQADIEAIKAELLAAIQNGYIRVYPPNKNTSYKPEIPRSFHDEIYWDDLNSYLALFQSKVQFRLPKPLSSLKPDWQVLNITKSYSIESAILLSMNLDEYFFFMHLGSGLSTDDALKVKNLYEDRFNFFSNHIKSKSPNWIDYQDIKFPKVSLIDFASWAVKYSEWDIPEELRRLAKSEFIENQKISVNLGKVITPPDVWHPIAEKRALEIKLKSPKLSQVAVCELIAEEFRFNGNLSVKSKPIQSNSILTYLSKSGKWTAINKKIVKK